jgi:hypothetical protein
MNKITQQLQDEVHIFRAEAVLKSEIEESLFQVYKTHAGA